MHAARLLFRYSTFIKSHQKVSLRIQCAVMTLPTSMVQLACMHAELN